MNGPGTAAWFEGLLRDRLGPGAALGAITFEGRLLRIDGVRVPLGAAAELVLDRVAIELGAGLPLGGLPLHARLVGVRGEVRARGSAVALDFAALGDGGDGGDASWVNGRLRVGAPILLEATLTLRSREGGGFALVVSTARSRLEVAGSVDAAGALQGARLTGRVATAELGWVPTPLPEALLELDLTAEGSLADPWIRGRVFAAEVLLARPEAPGAVVRLEGVSAEIDLDRRRLHYQHLVAGVGGARFGAWGRVALAPPSSEEAAVPLLALQVERADGALLAQIAALGSARLRLARPGAPGLPADLTVTGELLVSAARAVEGSFALETPRSALLFHLTASASGELLGSTLRGRFAAVDAVTVGIVREPVRPRPADVVGLDARLTGTLARPGLTGRLSAARLALEVGGATLEIEQASVLLDVDSDRLAWQGLSGSLLGGRFASSGRIGRGGTLGATVEWSGVRVDALPVPALAAALRGASSGALRFERESLAEHALQAQGRVTVEDPVYLFVRSLAPALARYRLPPLRARGGGPIRADVRLSRGEMVVERLDAALDGIEVNGTIRRDRRGQLVGRAEVHLLQGYLARSPILAIPAALSSKVVLPVYIAGTASAPDLQTNAREILDGLIQGTRVGEAVKSALDGLRSPTRPPRKPR